MILDPNQPFVDKAQRLSSWGHWFTFFNILVALLISSGFIVTDAVPSTPLGLTYLLTNWIGHTAFITFIGFILSIFPLSLIFPYPRHVRGMAAIIATSAMVLLSIDAYSYSRLGYHVSAASLEQVVGLLTNSWNNHPWRSFLWVFGISSLILLVQLLLSNFTWKHLESLKQKGWGGKLGIFFLTAFTASHLIHIWADAKFDYDVTKQNNMFPFSYPATAKTLLAKNGLLDKQQHMSHQTSQLSMRRNLDYYPGRQTLHCDISQTRHDLVILLSTTALDPATIAQLSDQGYQHFDKHYVPGKHQDAVFDLLYGVPAVYRDSIIANGQSPQWVNIAQGLPPEQAINIDLDTRHSPALSAYHFINVAPSNNNDNNDNPGVSIRQIAAAGLQPYLTTLNNGQGDSNVIIIGHSAPGDSAVNKTAMLVKWSQPLRYRGQVTQNLDISATIIQSWLNCRPDSTAKTRQKLDVFGKNILHKQPKVLAANYTDGTIISIHKDKITLLDEQGNSRRISASNGYILSQENDIPGLNDTINLLKKYSVRKKP